MDDYTKAVEYFSNNEFTPAEEILLNLLEQDNNDYDVINFLGIIQLNLGNYKKAINYFNQVLFLFDRHSNALYNLAYCYEKVGKINPAIDKYRKALEVDQKFTEAYLNLGQLLISKDEFTEAEVLYNKAIENIPNNHKLFNNLGNLYLKLNKWQEAIEKYESAIALDNTISDYYFNIGSCFLKTEQYENARLNLEKAIQLKPDHLGAINNLALIYIKINQTEKAVELYKKIISFDENNAEAYFNLANSYHDSDNLNDAINYYEKAIQIDPQFNSANINLGRIYLQRGETNKAENYFNKAVQNKDDKVIAFTNLGVARLEDLQINEAISFFDIAIKSKYDIVEAHYNKAHALLLKGNYKEGWQEYEWRKKRKDFIKPNLTKPELTSKNIANKKILVYAEQGLGDTINFVRYLKLLKEKECHIIFQCDKNLASLIKNVSWMDELIITENLDELNIQYDYQIALLSLPYYFETNFDTIPRFDQYLFPDSSLNEKWDSIINANKNDNLKVGFVWAGNPNNNRDKIRSIPLLNFLSMFSVKGIDFYSLQVGPAADQLSDLYYPIKRLDKYIKNFSDTASAISKLDLIISVDTSVAHLAGALGKPVWTMLMYLPDWRWLLNKAETSWYPSMRLYRQQSKGDWESVLSEVVFDLQKLVKNRKFIGIETNLEIQPTNENIGNGKNDIPLYLGLSDGENFGWGICSKYLYSELSEKLNIINLKEVKSRNDTDILPGFLFNAIVDVSMKGFYNSSGKKNYGYTFFENEIPSTAKNNAVMFDLILAGSTWCKQKLNDAGINNSEVLIQGIDPNLFYPINEKRDDNLFVIFSGGKFELRKGQDLVLKAIKVLQQKYSDIILINAWYNLWPEVMASMQYSNHIKYEISGKIWQEMMASLYKANDINPSKIFSLPLIPNDKLRELYAKSDIGLFPNRCEGGTNLVMMEYMACGKPVVASYNSGHKDILNDENSFPLKTMHDFKLFDENNNITADWNEPDLDEIIERIEFAYHNRDHLRKVGRAAGEHLKNYTWSNTADELIQIIYG
jgi:tetratricopeptide (TPR) repeat protein/glycosyltransferase involved in cell wall biosynthesis